MAIATPALDQRLRMVGLRESDPPSLERVERRRLQLWMLAGFVIIAAGGAAVLAGMELDTERYWWARPGSLHLSLLALSVGFVLYAIEKEVHLRRLTRQLIDERALSAVLSSRVEELSSLMEAGTAVNSVLELDEVLRIILRSAIELLGGADGSVMLVGRDGMLEAVSTYGNDGARGVRVNLGDGIAGRVAETREPLLINGIAGESEFPNRVERTKPVESAMSVPLVNRDELLGVLNCNAAPERTFTELDLRAFTLFAEQAASAIANARLYESQREHVEELLKIDEMKNEFISSVSHDLRTPLTSIVGSASVAMRPDLPDSSRTELLTSIERQARRLEGMVQQLLEAAALQETPSGDPIEPADITARAQMLAAEYASTGQPVEVLGPRGALVACGEAPLDRILSNLIDNACKHGAPPVHIRIADASNEIRCAITDAGAGIPESDRERVFERFYRADPSRSTLGLGLGLSIVKSITEAHGGRTWIEDAPGGSSAICFALPRATALTGAPAEDADTA